MFSHSKDVGSSPEAFKYFYSFFFNLLFSLSLFLILCTTGYMYMYLNLPCVYVTNKGSRIISISLHVINSWHAEYF